MLIIKIVNNDSCLKLYLKRLTRILVRHCSERPSFSKRIYSENLRIVISFIKSGKTHCKKPSNAKF